ncbi:MAG: hypothetical protein AUH28_17610 [Acidobacteria bacterium 13_1_40CM_56_16]|nr:MAG: hypothetical protein AUH28_17610 [Acidobacteria bacterium 13_1_40CM_56_16]OLD71740.1 MAG: hypothetical protein AUI45_00855 [Acidobacteria bacterium 13_1_40CM_2_56_11]
MSDGSLSADAFVNVTVTPAVTISPTTMLFAQFANGSGITSDVVLTNPSASIATGAIELFNRGGTKWQVFK